MEDFFYLKKGNRYSQIIFSEILFIEVKDKYTEIVTKGGKHLTLQPPQNIERILPGKMFCRIHRSFIISLTHTKWFDHANATVGSIKLPIGKNYKDALLRRVLSVKNENKGTIPLTDYDMLSMFRQIKPN
jgi:DNA-binding LytR/AlgR family response regulator